jgi:hypothetical protein
MKRVRGFGHGVQCDLFFLNVLLRAIWFEWR